MDELENWELSGFIGDFTVPGSCTREISSSGQGVNSMAGDGDKEDISSSSGSRQGKSMTTTPALFIFIISFTPPQECYEMGTHVWDQPGKEFSRHQYRYQ